MLPFIRILLLWVTLLFTSHGALTHFWLGRVADETLGSGIEPHALGFYGFVAAFAIAAYYFCSEIEDWKKSMPVKVVVAAVLAVCFLGGLSGLENLDQAHYRDVEKYQKEIVAGRFDTQPSELPRLFGNVIPVGASREEAGKAFPNSLPTKFEVRRDGTAYENFFYWMGPGTLPIGAQVSYSTAPHRVEKVEALPRAMPPPPGPVGRETGPKPGDAEGTKEGER